VQEWRVRSRTFLTSTDVLALVNAPLSSCPYSVREGDDMSSTDRSKSHSHSYSHSQSDCQSATTSDSLSVSIGSQYAEYRPTNRRVTEARDNESETVGFSDLESDSNSSEIEPQKDSLILLQETINLYLEPRLLRIQPPETLDLRALAFLISARTAVKSISRHHSSSSSISIYGSVHLLDSKFELCSKDILKENTGMAPRKDDGLLTLKALKMIAEGGKHFLALREDALKKNREVDRHKDQTVGHESVGDMCLLASVGCSAAQEVPTGSTFCGSLSSTKELESSVHLSDFRGKLYKRIEVVTAAVSDRFIRCAEALKATSTVKCNRSLPGCHSRLSDLGCDSYPLKSHYDHPYLADTLSTGSTAPIDLHEADRLLGIAGQGIYLKEEYAFARLKNILLRSMRDCKSREYKKAHLLSDYDFDFHNNGTTPVVSDSGDTMGRLDGSIAPLNEVKQYCWCRGADDGSPMVQCDGCDEWFHSSCMGLTKQKATAPKGSGSGSGRDAVKGELPVPPIVAGKAKSKTKGTAIKTTKQLEGVVDICFYCIACTEDMGEMYPHRWESDFF
jgi:hypothetical protein